MKTPFYYSGMKFNVDFRNSVYISGNYAIIGADHDGMDLHPDQYIFMQTDN